MRLGYFTVFYLATLLLEFSGCATINPSAPQTPARTNKIHNPPIENQSQKDQWLKRNYPDRVSYLNELPTAQAYFRDDVLAGHIQLGMTVEEAMIATGTAPYGPKAFKGKFWCDNKTTDRCDTVCNICEGILFLGNQLVYVNGSPLPLTVIDVENQTETNSIFTPATHATKFQIAEALYRNEIVIGMSITQVQRVLSETNTNAKYYCDSLPINPPDICDSRCKICIIETNFPQNPRRLSKAIYIQAQADERRVIRVDSLGVNQ